MKWSHLENFILLYPICTLSIAFFLYLHTYEECELLEISIYTMNNIRWIQQTSFLFLGHYFCILAEQWLSNSDTRFLFPVSCSILKYSFSLIQNIDSCNNLNAVVITVSLRASHLMTPYNTLKKILKKKSYYKFFFLYGLALFHSSLRNLLILMFFIHRKQSLPPEKSHSIPSINIL